jgi:hypothetical protein
MSKLDNNTFTIRCNSCGQEIEYQDNSDDIWWGEINIHADIGGEIYISCDCGNKVAKIK